MFFPELKDVRLTDYKVRVLNEQEGTGAKVRVLIESAYEDDSWSTIGVSKNIIEASRQALSDSFNYRLAKLSKWKIKIKNHFSLAKIFIDYKEHKSKTRFLYKEDGQLEKLKRTELIIMIIMMVFSTKMLTTHPKEDLIRTILLR